MRVAVVQMNSGADTARNVGRALELVDQAASRGARLAVLPEYMTYLGPAEGRGAAAEPIPGPTTRVLGERARAHEMFILCGSLVERTERADRFANTSVLIDPQGRIAAIYRKVHLFDVNVPDGVTEQESATIEPGDSLVTAEVGELLVGLSICFDLRFPELYRALAAAGATVLAVPSAFYEATGRAHWEILLRARAIENHAYVLAAAQHGINGAGNRMHGHSMIVDPWGTVLATVAAGDAVLTADVDPGEALRRRRQVPVLAARRSAAYERVVRADAAEPENRGRGPATLTRRLAAAMVRPLERGSPSRVATCRAPPWAGAPATGSALADLVPTRD